MKEHLIKQKEIANAAIIKKAETQILLAENNPRDTVANQFGWTEHIEESERILAEQQEIINLTKKHGTLFSYKDIMNLCFTHNYILDKAANYKGPIPKQLLETIAKVAESKEVRFNSAANQDQLYIFAPFEYFTGDPLKLRKKKNLQKIILFWKESDARYHNQMYFSIIDEVGEYDVIKRKVRNIFFTHLKTANFLRKCTISILYNVLLWTTFLGFNKETLYDHITPTIIFGGSLVWLLIFRMFYMDANNARGQSPFNAGLYYEDGYFETISHGFDTFLCSYITKRTQHHNNFHFSTRKLYKHQLIGRTIMIIPTILIMWSLWANRLVPKEGEIRQFTKTYCNCDNTKKPDEIWTVKRTSFLTYKTEPLNPTK